MAKQNFWMDNGGLNLKQLQKLMKNQPNITNNEIALFFNKSIFSVKAIRQRNCIKSDKKENKAENQKNVKIPFMKKVSNMISEKYNGLNESNILVIGDLHEPFSLKGYLEHCKKMQIKYRCGIVMFMGDIVDNHSISYHEHDPDLWSPIQEMEKADKKLSEWFEAFPKAYVVWGNHDRLPSRKGKTAGLPKRCFKSFREMWKFPDGWIDGPRFIIHNVLFKHVGKSGTNGPLATAIVNRINVCIGHTHSVGVIGWNVSVKDRIFGMNPGCGVNYKHMAFAYGKDIDNKPFIGCGVILDKGRLPIIEPMEL